MNKKTLKCTSSTHLQVQVILFTCLTAEFGETRVTIINCMHLSSLQFNSAVKVSEANTRVGNERLYQRNIYTSWKYLPTSGKSFKFGKLATETVRFATSTGHKFSYSVSLHTRTHVEKEVEVGIHVVGEEWVVGNSRMSNYEVWTLELKYCGCWNVNSVH